jgi:hypothetical protein
MENVFTFWENDYHFQEVDFPEMGEGVENTVFLFRKYILLLISFPFTSGVS